MFVYVLIIVEQANVQDLFEELINHERVADGHVLFGEWDIILKIKAESPEDASSFVLEELRTRREVKLTSSLIVAR
ncbi:MAG: Lrp/AsnC ligand binding domain-containing protein [Candidatus Woesearchaeota archaeon]|nr:MAG: Lrp/AsnC ligand binding domain-containing protein [Candidatus Woesearchaeota archaeon]